MLHNLYFLYLWLYNEYMLRNTLTTYLIVGLGNPDKQYLDTFHNVGYMCVDTIANKLGVKFIKGECRAITATYKTASYRLILAKPITYMNLSGESVRELVHKYKIEQSKCIIIYDDVDIPLGAVRIRSKGSAGTHNGMRNIVAIINTEDIYRIRIGIGQPHTEQLYDYVLSHIVDKDRQALSQVFDRASDACIDFVNGATLDNVMQKYN